MELSHLVKSIEREYYWAVRDISRFTRRHIAKPAGYLVLAGLAAYVAVQGYKEVTNPKVQIGWECIADHAGITIYQRKGEAPEYGRTFADPECAGYGNPNSFAPEGFQPVRRKN